MRGGNDIAAKILQIDGRELGRREERAFKEWGSAGTAVFKTAVPIAPFFKSGLRYVGIQDIMIVRKPEKGEKLRRAVIL